LPQLLGQSGTFPYEFNASQAQQAPAAGTAASVPSPNFPNTGYNHVPKKQCYT